MNKSRELNERSSSRIMSPPFRARTQSIININTLPIADFIEGPLSCTKHVSPSHTIYIFGEQHGLSQESGLCNPINNTNYVRIEEFIKQWIEQNIIPIQIYLEIFHDKNIIPDEIKSFDEFLKDNKKLYKTSSKQKHILKIRKANLSELTMLNSDKIFINDIRDVSTFWNDSHFLYLCTTDLNNLETHAYDTLYTSVVDFFTQFYDIFNDINELSDKYKIINEELLQSDDIMEYFLNYVQFKDDAILNVFEYEDKSVTDFIKNEHKEIYETFKNDNILSFVPSIIIKKNQDQIIPLFESVMNEIPFIYDKIEALYNMIFHLTVLFMDAYTLLHLNISPIKNVIIYNGDFHADRYRRYLIEMGFRTMEYEYNETGCLNMKDFSQPFFV